MQTPDRSPYYFPPATLDPTDTMNIDFRRHWALDPGTTFLNHGSFGATPKRLLNEQSEFRERLERNPVQFIDRELPGLLDRARAELADFVDADPTGLAFVRNATAGVNAVLRSLEFDPGDELLVTNHGYRSCRNAIDYVAERTGATVTVAQVPFPCESADAIVDAVMAAVTPKTELAMIDHVTSRTGLVLPVGELVERLEERHVATLVDGAHAPGMLDLSVADVGADYYVGNCHKWLCAPKGAGFLWVNEHDRSEIHPPTISYWYREATEARSAYHMEFDWTGTDDPTPWLCVPPAIDYLASLVPDGWPGLRERNRELALEARDILCDALEVDPPAPDDLLGTLATVPLPDRPADAEVGPLYGDPLQRELSEEHGFEVPVVDWPEAPKRHIRVSAHLYNRREEYEELATALEQIV